MGQGKAGKVNEKTHDLDHNLKFYWTHNLLYVPQYKFNGIYTNSLVNATFGSGENRVKQNFI